MSPYLHHSTSADDLLLHHTKNTQEGSCGVHSDEEIDQDVSSVTLKPEESSSTSGKQPVELAFSASAGAFVYQMGIAAYIQKHFDLTDCHLSGCSGGAWAATLLASETDVYEAWAVIKYMVQTIIPENPSWYTGYGRYGTIVAETIKELWKYDGDVHKRVEQKKLSIAVTRFPSMKAERHTSWEDLDDLMKSILASAMIPFALSGKPCITHRGNWYMDGGITNFKGVNCDNYSTLSDLYYHGMQLTVDTIRSTTSAVAERFFPSLTKPVAKLINGLLPNIESPHEAVAPRLTNGASNPQCADLSDTTRPRLIFKPWTWRSQHITTFHLSVDIATHQERFDMGYEDARAHHHELAALLPLKKPIAA